MTTPVVSGRSAHVRRALPVVWLPAAVVAVVVLAGRDATGAGALGPTSGVPAGITVQQATGSSSGTVAAEGQTAGTAATTGTTGSSTAGTGATGGGTGSGPATQGTGSGGTGNGGGADGATAGPGTPGATGPGVDPRCVGTPLRQNFSVYAPPCAPVFTGDNGGATYAGVDATEIRFALIGIGTSYEGRVPTEAQPNETAVDRTVRVLQIWFNQNYQLYGRHLQLVSLAGARGTSSQAALTAAASTYGGVVGAWQMSGDLNTLGPQAKLISLTDYTYPRDFFKQQQPYLYSWSMDNTTTLQLTAQYLCTKLAGHPASFTESPALTPPLTPVRKFGALVYSDDGYASNGPTLQALAKQACGIDVDVAAYGLSDPSTLATAITKLAQDGATTNVFLADFVTGGRALTAASAQGYLPEWLIVPFGGVDASNSYATSVPQEQWKHAFGITSRPLPQATTALEYYRAYQQVDPANTPDASSGAEVFTQLSLLGLGFQSAGPTLSPDTFQAGLRSLGHRTTAGSAVWAVSGGFDANDFSYVDDVVELWWDVTAQSYRYTNNGKRYSLGTFTPDTSALFTSGITTAPTS